MGLAQELTLAEAVKPLTAFRYKSRYDGLAVIAAEAGQFTKPDYQFRSLINLANAGNAAS